MKRRLIFYATIGLMTLVGMSVVFDADVAAWCGASVEMVDRCIIGIAVLVACVGAWFLLKFAKEEHTPLNKFYTILSCAFGVMALLFAFVAQSLAFSPMLTVSLSALSALMMVCVMRIAYVHRLLKLAYCIAIPLLWFVVVVFFAWAENAVRTGNM